MCKVRGTSLLSIVRLIQRAAISVLCPVLSSIRLLCAVINTACRIHNTRKIFKQISMSFGHNNIVP